MNTMGEHDFIAWADRYLQNEMTMEERWEFESFCEANPDAAERLSAHRKFIVQLKNHARRAAFKRTLRTAGPKAKNTVPPGNNDRQTPILSLWNKFKINALIAASVAILAVFSTLWMTGYYAARDQTSSNFSALRREMNTVKKNVHAQNAVIRSINHEQNQAASPGQFGATGFIVAPEGYVVTNYHVIREADSVHLYNTNGDTYRAKVVHVDPSVDIAMLYISDTTFRKLKSTPYTFKETDTELGEEVFTLGFPRDEPVYGQGYLSSRTGYLGDTTAYQISIPLNPGNSGGPLLDHRGNIIGIVRGKQTGLDGASFAIKTDALLRYISEIPTDSLPHPLIINRKNTLVNLSRIEQVKRIQDYVFMVKTY